MVWVVLITIRTTSAVWCITFKHSETLVCTLWWLMLFNWKQRIIKKHLKLNAKKIIIINPEDIIGRKSKQRWWTFPTISSKRTLTSRVNSLNTKKIPRHMTLEIHVFQLFWFNIANHFQSIVKPIIQYT